MSAENQAYYLREVELFEQDLEFRKNALAGEFELNGTEYVLDVGCGAGQEMLPFALAGVKHCIGIDIARESGQIGIDLFRRYNLGNAVSFLIACAEWLPIRDQSIDVVICRVALPLMNQKAVLSEVSRVLKRGGKFFVKIYSPRFHLRMLRQRIHTFDLRLLGYPVLCILASVYFQIFGRQLLSGFGRGKEIYRTTRDFENDLRDAGLTVLRQTRDSSKEAPAFLAVKQ
jgi:ubiquinone/menaquinone biosynthesis C-methylase UbiE